MNEYEPTLQPIVQTRRTLAVVMMIGLLILAAAWVAQLLSPGRGTDPDALRQVQTGINPNTATWYELAQLPGLGESAGRAIVAYREERRQATTQAVFVSASDLEPVPGIGPRTIERIAPHLRFDGGD